MKKKVIKIFKRFETKRKEFGMEGTYDNFQQYMTEDEKELIFNFLRLVVEKDLAKKERKIRWYA